MYKKENKIINSIEDISNYIEGADIYNSQFLSYLFNPTLGKVSYQITVYEYRPDLICKDFYGDIKYYGIFLLQTKMELSEYKKGVILRLLPKDTIDNLFSLL